MHNNRVVRTYDLQTYNQVLQQSRIDVGALILDNEDNDYEEELWS